MRASAETFPFKSYKIKGSPFPSPTFYACYVGYERGGLFTTQWRKKGSQGHQHVSGSDLWRTPANAWKRKIRREVQREESTFLFFTAYHEFSHNLGKPGTAKTKINSIPYKGLEHSVHQERMRGKRNNSPLTPYLQGNPSRDSWEMTRFLIYSWDLRFA